MEFKGTKGKWEIADGLDNKILLECNNPNWTICYTVSGFDQDKANAQLISKAPEMLKMWNKELQLLKLVSKQLDELGGYLVLDVDERIKEIEKLIKEATEL